MYYKINTVYFLRTLNEDNYLLYKKKFTQHILHENLLRKKYEKIYENNKSLMFNSLSNTSLKLIENLKKNELV